jgi:hypothetical protein
MAGSSPAMTVEVVLLAWAKQDASLPLVGREAGATATAGWGPLVIVRIRSKMISPTTPPPTPPHKREGCTVRVLN